MICDSCKHREGVSLVWIKCAAHDSWVIPEQFCEEKEGEK